MPNLTAIAGLQEALESGTLARVRHMLNGLSASEIAQVLEASPPHDRDVLWELVDESVESEVLQRLDEDVRNYILTKMDTTAVAALAEEWDADDIADILQQLPDR